MDNLSEIFQEGQPFSSVVCKAGDDFRADVDKFPVFAAPDRSSDLEARQDMWSIIRDYTCRNHIDAMTISDTAELH